MIADDYLVQLTAIWFTKKFQNWFKNLLAWPEGRICEDGKWSGVRGELEALSLLL